MEIPDGSVATFLNEFAALSGGLDEKKSQQLRGRTIRFISRGVDPIKPASDPKQAQEDPSVMGDQGSPATMLGWYRHCTDAGDEDGAYIIGLYFWQTIDEALARSAN